MAVGSGREVVSRNGERSVTVQQRSVTVQPTK